MGGAQGYFGVKPDITVLGKCLTGGYPMAGGIGGRRDVMMLLAGGIGTTPQSAPLLEERCPPIRSLVPQAISPFKRCSGLMPQSRQGAQATGCGEGCDEIIEPPRSALRRLQHGFRSSTCRPPASC